jgi:hypothetical protein
MVCEVMFARFTSMMVRVRHMSLCCVCVVGGFFMIGRFMMLASLAMVSRRVLVMLGGLEVMFCCSMFVGHFRPSP